MENAVSYYDLSMEWNGCVLISNEFYVGNVLFAENDNITQYSVKLEL